jgi:polygalacturonase
MIGAGVKEGAVLPPFSVAKSILGAASPAPSVSKNILDYGAKPDGVTLNTEAIQRAIDDTCKAGGGTVYAPPGKFLVGGLELKSGVTLYLESGCVLLGSTSIADYPYHPGPPMQGDQNGHHLLFAQKSENVALCGPGTIDGQGQAYWQPKAKLLPPSEAWRDSSSQRYEPKDNNLRPSPMIEFAECTNVRISGVTLQNSPGWTIRPIACDTVVIDGIRIRNPSIGVNTDGIDITCSRNVLVSNCDIACGDDAICLKSENYYGPVVPTKNIAVTNCVLTTPGSGLKLGTASKGAFENIIFSNSIIYADTATPIYTHPIAGISIELVDGGNVDGVVISNIRMQNVRAPIFVRLGERQQKAGTFLRNVLIENVDATGAIITSSITGVPGFRPSDITVSNCRIRTVEQGQAEWVRREIPEAADKYPESSMMGRLPAYGFFIRHADRVRLRNVECIMDKADGRPAIVCNDANDLILDGLELNAPAGNAPVIELESVQRALITGMRMPLGAKVLAQISGADSSGLSFAGNAFEPNGQTVVYTDGATAGALTPI